MTVSAQTPYTKYTCTGAVDYNFSWDILQEADIQVTYTDVSGNKTVLTLTTDYTVTFVSGDSGPGKITTVATYSSGYIELIRNADANQETDFTNYGTLDMETVEAAFDKAIMLIQQLQVQLQYAALIDVDTSAFDGALTSADDTVQKALDTLDDAFAASGTGNVVGPASAGDGNITVYSGTTGKVIKDSGKTVADLTYTAGDNITLVSNAFSATVPLGAKTGGDMKVASAGAVVIIHPGYREIDGKLYHWDSDLSFTIGSGGSNASSEAVPSSADMVYIYIDKSSLPASQSTALTAANFISKQTEPAWSDSKHGFYDGDDRLMGAFYHDGTNLIRQKKEGNLHWFFAPSIDTSGSFTNAAAASIDWTIPFIPKMEVANRVFFNHKLYSSSAGAMGIQYRRYSSSESLVHFYENGGGNYMYGLAEAPLDGSENKITIYNAGANAWSSTTILVAGFRYHNTI